MGPLFYILGQVPQKKNPTEDGPCRLWPPGTAALLFQLNWRCRLFQSVLIFGLGSFLRPSVQGDIHSRSSCLHLLHFFIITPAPPWRVKWERTCRVPEQRFFYLRSRAPILRMLLAFAAHGLLISFGSVVRAVVP